jgi:hypothetical protein
MVSARLQLFWGWTFDGRMFSVDLGQQKADTNPFGVLVLGRVFEAAGEEDAL